MVRWNLCLRKRRTLYVQPSSTVLTGLLRYVQCTIGACQCLLLITFAIATKQLYSWINQEKDMS